MKRLVLCSASALALFAPSRAPAQIECQTYRLVYQTVYDEHQVTAYRIENETVYDEREVTTYRPVTETEYRERRYTVARPVTETSEREERYRVQRPVWETEYRDASYDQVRDVVETSEREERHVVSRPVMETEEREERTMVRRQVLETAEREVNSTVIEPVTTYRTEYVDQGGIVEQQTVHPGPVHTRLRWLGGACVVDPLTGASTYQRPGFAWVPIQGPARVEVARVWQPNVVAQQIPQTNYVQRIVTQKVPVQVARCVDEEVVRKVPVQVCRMVQEEEVHRIPVTTHRQVTERVEKQVPVQVCKMVEEEVVRKIPVTTTRTVYEDRVEQVPVQVCKMVATAQTVRTPRVVEHRVPVNYTCRVPRTVVMRVPIETSESACCESTTVITSPSDHVYSEQPTRADARKSAASQSDKRGTTNGNGTKAPKLGPNDVVPGPSDEDDETPVDDETH